MILENAAFLTPHHCVVVAAEATMRIARQGNVVGLAAMLGISLCLDWEGEDCWIQTVIDHEPHELRTMLDALLALGLEPIPEEECPPTLVGPLEMRVYLARSG